MSWLEPAPASGGPKSSRRQTMEVKLEWLEPELRKSLRPKAGPPPLPKTSAKAKPPPLPAAGSAKPKPRRAHPPPIPREEPSESPRRSLRAPKR